MDAPSPPSAAAGDANESANLEAAKGNRLALLPTLLSITHSGVMFFCGDQKMCAQVTDPDMLTSTNINIIIDIGACRHHCGGRLATKFCRKLHLRGFGYHICRIEFPYYSNPIDSFYLHLN